MASIAEVVVGATRKDLLITLIDENGAPVNISGGTVRLQGQSPDIPAVDLDISGAIFDGANGVCKWASIGTAITAIQLGALPSATYTLRVRFVDAASKIDYGPLFDLTFLPTPI